MKATKDYKLLSFGDEAEEEEVVLKDVQVTFLINKKTRSKIWLLRGNIQPGHISKRKVVFPFKQTVELGSFKNNQMSLTKNNPSPAANRQFSSGLKG